MQPCKWSVEDLLAILSENCVNRDEGDDLQCIAALNKLLRDTRECICIIGNGVDIDNGLEPVDCEQMDNIHVDEVLSYCSEHQYEYFYLIG